MTQKSKQKNNGYAILFAIVIVSIITLLSLGLSNTAYKQLVLSSLASDSQTAYFQSDTATECALYADTVAGITESTNTRWSCGIMSSGTTDFLFSVAPFGTGGYSLTPVNADTSPCFEFDVDKLNTDPVSTIIYARGYNSCDKTNPKTVEREIKVTY